MKSQPLQTAFTSMTLALVIFLSIWVIQASQAELTGKTRVPLQVKTAPQSRENHRRDPRPDPFDNSEAQTESLSAIGRTQDPARNERPSVEMQGVRVRRVSDPELSQGATESRPAAKTLELPEISVSADGNHPSADLTDPGDLERMKAALSSETTARQELQMKIDSLTRKQAELKSALEQEQEKLSLTRQEKENIAEKLGKSESELVRLHTTTKELRSEATEMKNSLKDVSSEFDSLKKRFENLQRKPRELASLSLPPSELKIAPPPPSDNVPPPKKEDFLPPIIKDGKPGIPLAPPADNSRTPLIEADPLFHESEVAGNYPSMMCGESCTDTENEPARGLLPMLCRKLKQCHLNSRRASSAQKNASASCAETGICEPESHVQKGLFYQLCHLVRKGKSDKVENCGFESCLNCDCGCERHAARGLIPDVARWIKSCQTRGCFEECCCDPY